MSIRVLACIIGIHAWIRTYGPALCAQACRHCGQPRIPRPWRRP